MKVGYIRVSSHEQNTDRQLAELFDLDRVFMDKMTGKTRERPQLTEMMGFVREGDTLYVHHVERLGRDTRDLLNIVHELTSKGVIVTFVSNNLTFTGKDDDLMSKLMFAVLSAVAEFDRGNRARSAKEGIHLAKAKGVYTGRKASLTPEQAQEVKREFERGVSPSKLASRYGVHRSTIYGYAKGE